MEGQAGEHDAPRQPAKGIVAYRKQARPVRFLEVGQADGRSQPDDGPKRGVDPELWSHSAMATNDAAGVTESRNLACERSAM
jgi:hypothetical protein